MGIMRKTLLARLHSLLDIPVTGTYGYITKYYRELYHIEKSHINDAIMISKNFSAVPDDTWYVSKAVRRHNRQIHKRKILKGGIRKRNQADHTVCGLRLFDLVAYDKHLYYVFGRRKTGYMDIRTLNGAKVNKGSVSIKRLKYVSASTVLVERRKTIPLMDKSMSFLA